MVMVGTVYSTQTYTGRTAITDAETFIAALGADEFVEMECWSEAENTMIFIVYKTPQL